MASDEFEVAVVGAGPAGATCAIALANAGIGPVALIDRQRFPRDKCCGDGIGPGAVAVAMSLGLEEAFAGFAAVDALSVTGPRGDTVSGPLPLLGGKRPVGYVIPRYEFDNRLLRGALARGAEDLTGWALRDGAFDPADGRWTLRLHGTRGADDVRTVRARVLVGADGARSKVRQILGVPFNSDAHTGAAARVYASSSTALPPALHLEFAEPFLPVYGWIFPVSADKANVGIGVDVTQYKARKQQLQDLLAQYQIAHAGPGDFACHRGSYLAFLLPFGSEMPRLSHPERQAALIGDAASMVNPLTGEGIFYGMFAGKLLADCLAGRLVGSPEQLGEAITTFEAAFRDRFSGHFRLNAWMKRHTADPFKCNLVIKACRRSRGVLRDVTDLLVGDKRRLSLSTFAQIFALGLLPG